MRKHVRRGTSLALCFLSAPSSHSTSLAFHSSLCRPVTLKSLRVDKALISLRLADCEANGWHAMLSISTTQTICKASTNDLELARVRLDSMDGVDSEERLQSQLDPQLPMSSRAVRNSRARCYLLYPPRTGDQTTRTSFSRCTRHMSVAFGCA